MKTIQEFLNQYGGISFDKVKFRPGAPFTTDFGLDNTFNQFRIHNAIDRGCLFPGSTERNPIYCPFDCIIEYHPTYGGGFGSLLRIIVEDYGFEFRIMHTDECLVPNGFCKAGTLLAHAGLKGLGTGRHTHQEVVSFHMSNPILDEIIYTKLKNRFDSVVTQGEVNSYFRNHNLIGDPRKCFREEIEKRQITRLYSTGACLRRDYHDGKLKTFYDSRLLFGC